MGSLIKGFSKSPLKQWVFYLWSNSACFVYVNCLLLSKTYKKASGELTFGQGETTLSRAEMT